MTEIVPSRACSICKVIKPLTDYCRNVGMKYGVHPQCRECRGFKTRRPKRTIAERLEYYSIPEPNTGCLLWIGANDGRGYGHMTINKKTVKAYRVQWELVNGVIPKGVEVCHKCDTPACINPDHLFLGTHLQNMRDATSKGRMQHGRNGHAKLTGEKVISILGDKRPVKIISNKYGISTGHIYAIKRGARWSYLQNEV